MKVSMFTSIKSGSAKQLDFDEYISLVKKGIDREYVSKIKQIRKFYGKDEKQYTAQKEKLPIITPHAEIKGKREDANVLRHSGIVSVDVDEKNNDIKKIDGFHDPDALAYHSSISGRGLVIYYRFDVDKSTHRNAFEYVAQRLKDKFGINADPHVKALSVPRFISYDPDVVYNRDAKIFKVQPKTESQVESIIEANEDDQEQLREITKAILKSKTSLLDDRETWIKFAAVYCRAFGGNTEGLDLFESISKLSPKYKSHQDCRTVYKSFVGKQTDKPATIGSVLYEMELAGIEYESELGGQLEHFDVPKIEKLESAGKTDKELAYLESFLVVEKPEDEVPIVQFENADGNLVTVCSEGNHTLVIGKKKSRKSLFIGLLIEQSKKTGQIRVDQDVVVCDTEQGTMHSWQSRERIKMLTGKYPRVLQLRGELPETRRKIISLAVKYWKPWLLIIDGVRDLLYDINDTKECTKVVTWIEDLTIRTGVHIVNVLHLNKTDGNARGHIGSELLNKAETTFELELSKDKDRTIVKCESSRGEPFADFAFTHYEDPRYIGLSIAKRCELPVSATKDQFSPEDIKEKLKTIFEDSPKGLAPRDLLKRVKEEFGKGDSLSRQLINRLVKEEYIYMEGKKFSPSAIYRLKT